jgi:hypothetical protein
LDPREAVMNVLPSRNRSPVGATAANRQDTGWLQAVGRFAVHFGEMCAVMCLGAIALSLLFFGAASRLGYTDMFQQYPELSVLVLAINLSLPMAVWMRFRGMDWRPTLEMSGSTMLVGVFLIVAYRLDLIAAGSLLSVQTSLACPLMLAVMLARFGLYSGHQAHQLHPV